MFENEQANSEINLNLKMPPEQPDGDFSMKNLVLTIYDAKKTFLMWCCIGLALGIIAAVGYFILNTYISPPAVQGDVKVTLTLNYSGASVGGAAAPRAAVPAAPVAVGTGAEEYAMLPNGVRFDMRFFYEDVDIWENALRKVGNSDVTVGDLISQVRIENQKHEELIVDNVFILTIPYDYDIFDNIRQKEDFLQALCEEFKDFVINKYYTDVSIGMLYDQQLKVWDETSVEIPWDPFRFDINFSALNTRYRELADILTHLYNADPNYRTAEGKNFDDYARELKDIYIKDITSWNDRLLNNIYIRNIDQFTNEARFRVATMERNRHYYSELVETYNTLLAAFQQTEAQGVVVEEAVEVLLAVQEYAVTAADLQRQIEQMEYYIEMLRLNDRMIRSNSRDAETALVRFIEDLGENQQRLRAVIYDYYKQMHERAAETSVIYSNSLVVESEEQEPASGGVSMTRLLMILIGLTFIGFVIGFCATFVKKYIAEQ